MPPRCCRLHHVVYYWFLIVEVRVAAWIAPRRPAAKGRLPPSPRGSTSASVVRAPNNVNASEDSRGKVLVLGGTGFVGRRVVDLLDRKGVPCVATSTQGRGGTVALDLTDHDAGRKLLEIYRKNDATAIVSTVGSIFAENNYEINSASGRAAAAAFGSDDFGQEGELPKYIFVGNSPRIRNACNAVSSLKEYARGKEESERSIEETFGARSCIVKPTFIYGGDDFGLNPPRLPSGPGAVIEALLGLYPVQAASEALPDVIGVALEAPVSVESVAGAVVNVATGLCDDSTVLDSREDIIMAASKRPAVGAVNQSPKEMERRRDELKTILSEHASEHTPEENFAMLEELERIKPASTRPTEDPSLNGRWDFCFDVEPDVGTGFIKDLFEGNGPGWAKKIVDFRGVHMEIGDGQSAIRLVVSVAVFEREATLILHTSLSPASSDPDGTMFREKFEGIELNGVRLPYPKAWKRSRCLEFSYLDDGFAVARGAGGEPHFLLRGG